MHLLRDPLPGPRGRSRLTTIIAIGNRFRRDDAAGLAVADRLRDSGLSPGCTLIEREGEPLDLIADWQPDDDVIVVDAVRAGSRAGTVHRLDALEAPLPAPMLKASSHMLGIAEAIEVARALDRLPRSLHVFGIEVGDVRAGLGLGPEVTRAVEEVADALRADMA